MNLFCYTGIMRLSKTPIIMISVILTLVLIGAGCTDASDSSFPPKPPVPGIHQSPAIERLVP